jgi:hypothetical protein
MAISSIKLPKLTSVARSPLSNFGHWIPLQCTQLKTKLGYNTNLEHNNHGQKSKIGYQE